MLRIIHKAETPSLSTDHKCFSCISKIIRLANRHTGARFVLDMKKTFKADGNLASMYSALNFNLNKSENILSIFPRKACSLKVKTHQDMFGYFSTWEEELENTFQSGGTKVFAFDPFEYEKFNDYLFYDAFRQDWKRKLPYHYKTDIKDFLRKLFRNASEHSNTKSPIFISSAYDGEMLKFTMTDCGEGFFNVFRKVDDEVLNESEAVCLALNGLGVKNGATSGSLKLLGDYCIENNGELFVVSGGASVLYKKDGFHQSGWLPGAFRGSIINLSVRIELPEFLLAAA